MKEIEVNTQSELDAIGADFEGIIKILGVGIHIKMRYKYSVKALSNSSVVALGNSSVKALDNSSVEAWDNSSVVALGNSSVKAWGNSCVRIVNAIKHLSLCGFSVLFKPFDLKFKFRKEKTCLVQNYKPQKFLDRDGIKPNRGSVILYKRVSHDFKTQEGTDHETLWEVGATITHPNWHPETGECGAGKFHACSRPYFCDEFRNKPDDRYVAIKIKVADLHEWENPNYPHKIAFRKGMVLYVVDRLGREIKCTTHS